MRRLTWAISLSLLVHFSSGQKQCFYPNGQVAANDFPCDPSAEASPCCGPGRGNACLTNKLCRGADGNIIRGSCTDKSWNSPECADYCLSASTGGHDLISCSNVTKTDTSYCCDGRRAFCCDDGVGRFDVFPSNPQILANWDVNASAYVTVSRASTTTSAISSTPTASETGTGTSTQQTSASSTSTPTSSPTSIDTVSQSTSASASALPLAAQAGIGAGAGILVLALAAVAFLWFKLRRSKKKQTALLLAEKERQQEQQQQGGLGGGPPGWYPGLEEHKFGGEVWHHQGAMGLGVVPKAELGGVMSRSELEGGLGYGPQQAQARFELPSTPGRGRI